MVLFCLYRSEKIFLCKKIQFKLNYSLTLALSLVLIFEVFVSINVFIKIGKSVTRDCYDYDCRSRCSCGSVYTLLTRWDQSNEQWKQLCEIWVCHVHRISISEISGFKSCLLLEGTTSYILVSNTTPFFFAVVSQIWSL